MKVVITGGAGFIGQRLARRILEIGRLQGPSGAPEPIDELLLLDLTAPEAPPGRLRCVAGDIAEPAVADALLDRDDLSVFHLASVVSGAGERDFDLALRVNLTGGLNLLEACRRRAGRARFVFASSIAVFGGAAMPAEVGDRVKQTPETTYGTTKAILELLVNDYSRKGFLDGRSARLPAIVVRPGPPNAAASGFASGVFREPLAGNDYALPVGLETAMPLLGYRACVDGLIALHELPAERLGGDRAVGLPALTVTVEDMIAALWRGAGGRPLGAVSLAPDPFVEAICATWPRAVDAARARALGLPSESSLDEIVADYIADYVDA